MSEPLLRVEKITKNFRGLTAVLNVSFDVTAGQIKAMIGPNGAGKTTIFNLLCGFLPLSGGQVGFDGHSIIGLPSHRVAERGLIRTFQNVRLFHHMTVLENVAVGLHRQTRTGFWAGALDLPFAHREEVDVEAKSRAVLKFVGLEAEAQRHASHLPFGQQRLLELGRAFASSPRLLLLDEPAAGLNEQETAQLGELIRRMREAGTTILLVEHDMHLVMGVADEILVLNYGEKIAEGTPREIQNDPAVVVAYLGRARQTRTAATHRQPVVA